MSKGQIKEGGEKRAGADKKQLRLDFILGSGVMCVLSKESDKSLNLVE